MPGNPNYSTDVLTATVELYLSRKPKDAIFQKVTVLDVLNKRAKIARRGGIKLLEPLMYAKSSSGGSYSGYDVFDVSPQEGLTNAEFQWKYYYWTVTISGQEELENAGEAEMLNLLQAKINQAELSMQDLLGQHVFLDGTGNGGKNLTGLALMVDNAGTYGNIARASNAWWAAQENGSSVALTPAGSNGMRRMFNDCSYGQMTQTPNLIITTQEGFESYEALMDSNMRYTNTGEANVGYAKPSLMFRDAQLFWDDYCQDGHMYFLNTSFINFVVNPERDFKVTPFKVPANGDSKVMQILFAGNLTCSNCRHQGKFTALTNA